MCKLCDKSDAMIDMIEDFFTVADLKQVLWELLDGKDPELALTAEALNVKSVDDIKDMDVWVNFIATMCARWFIRHNFSPMFAIRCFSEAHAHQYNKDMAIRLFQQQHGRVPTSIEIAEKLRELES